jgi:hypothetical protein
MIKKFLPSIATITYQCLYEIWLYSNSDKSDADGSNLHETLFCDVVCGNDWFELKLELGRLGM